MFTMRNLHAIINYNNSVYVFGGTKHPKNSEFMDFTYEAWLPLRWDRIPPMIESKCALGAAECNGNIYLAGALSSKIEVFSTVSKTFSLLDGPDVRFDRYDIANYAILGAH